MFYAGCSETLEYLRRESPRQNLKGKSCKHAFGNPSCTRYPPFRFVFPNFVVAQMDPFGHQGCTTYSPYLGLGARSCLFCDVIS